MRRRHRRGGRGVASRLGLAGGVGLSALAQDGAADGLLAVTRQLGRLGCPVPLGDAYVTAALLDLVGADPSTVYEGSVRLVVHAGQADGGRIPYLEGLPGATHVAVLDPASGAFRLHHGPSSTPSAIRS